MPDLATGIAADAAEIAGRVDLSPLHGKTVLITGVSGLIGIYMLAALRAANQTGARIRIHATGRSTPPDFLAPLFAGADVTFHACDLTEAVACDRLPRDDAIVHAAGYGQPGKFMMDPVKTIQLNTAATATLARKVEAGGRFLFVSSSEIYSGSTHGPHREDDIGTTAPDHPRACYIEGKRCGEAICHAARSGGLDAKIARLALAYGPGTRPDDQRVLNSLIRKGLQQGRIDMMDAGAARRTYGYVTDAVTMILNILLHGRETTYNVGGTSEVTIRALADRIGTILGVPVFAPEASQGMAGAPGEVKLDLGRYQAEFGAVDFVPLEEGLRRTVDWQKALYRV